MKLLDMSLDIVINQSGLAEVTRRVPETLSAWAALPISHECPGTEEGRHQHLQLTPCQAPASHSPLSDGPREATEERALQGSRLLTGRDFQFWGMGWIFAGTAHSTAVPCRRQPWTLLTTTNLSLIVNLDHLCSNDSPLISAQKSISDSFRWPWEVTQPQPAPVTHRCPATAPMAAGDELPWAGPGGCRPSLGLWLLIQIMTLSNFISLSAFFKFKLHHNLN